MKPAAVPVPVGRSGSLDNYIQMPLIISETAKSTVKQQKAQYIID